MVTRLWSHTKHTSRFPVFCASNQVCACAIHVFSCSFKERIQEFCRAKGALGGPSVALPERVQLWSLILNAQVNFPTLYLTEVAELNQRQTKLLTNSSKHSCVESASRNEGNAVLLPFCAACLVFRTDPRSNRQIQPLSNRTSGLVLQT